MTARFLGAIVTAFLVMTLPGLLLRYARGVPRQAK